MRIEKIRLDEVKKAYGDIKALEDISLSLYQGELLCVVGLSGSGKSVLADIISGRTPKDGGRMYVDGRPAVFASIRQAQTAGIFCVRYRTSVINDISVEESLCLLQKQGGLSFPARQGMIHMRETLKSLEVECRLQAPAASLSLMEHHTIEICRACCAGMKVLILDGIARDYTLKETEYMKRLVIRLRERGISILWIDTRPEIMLDAADRLAVLRKGRLAAVLYREEFDRQVIDPIIIGENRKAEREVARSQSDPGERAVLLSVRKVRARELRDVSFYVCPGEVVGFIHPEDTYCREIVRLL
ncbi:MAG: ATP-binding cassette domain-containing protein, partial [Clostridia bacterium]|nr:ATP-binding cassette domain-containing protein [Clostridia bacterium]